MPFADSCVCVGGGGSCPLCRLKRVCVCVVVVVVGGGGLVCVGEGGGGGTLPTHEIMGREDSHTDSSYPMCESS